MFRNDSEVKQINYWKLAYKLIIGVAHLVGKRGLTRGVWMRFAYALSDPEPVFVNLFLTSLGIDYQAGLTGRYDNPIFVGPARQAK